MCCCRSSYARQLFISAMATTAASLGYEDDEDVDVVWEGSPLHEHLKAHGIEEETESHHLVRPTTQKLKRLKGQQSLAHHVHWPKGCNSILEIEVAKKIMESELLVQVKFFRPLNISASSNLQPK